MDYSEGTHTIIVILKFKDLKFYLIFILHSFVVCTVLVIGFYLANLLRNALQLKYEQLELNFCFSYNKLCMQFTVGPYDANNNFSKLRQR